MLDGGCWVVDVKEGKGGRGNDEEIGDGWMEKGEV